MVQQRMKLYIFHTITGRKIVGSLETLHIGVLVAEETKEKSMIVFLNTVKITELILFNIQQTVFLVVAYVLKLIMKII